jgi:hypothetical protein
MPHGHSNKKHKIAELTQQVSNEEKSRETHKLLLENYCKFIEFSE